MGEMSRSDRGGVTEGAERDVPLSKNIFYKNFSSKRINSWRNNMSEITKLARDLRNNQTYAEKLLWSEIKNRKLGFKFRRQHPLSCSCNGESHFFISDFACLEKKIIIDLAKKLTPQRFFYLVPPPKRIWIIMI